MHRVARLLVEPASARPGVGVLGPPRHAVLCLAAALAVWLAASALMTPQFAGTDVFIFREAGANWALGRGFASRMIPGNLTFGSEFYSSYPPLLPLTFGLYSKVVGIGPYQDTIFNLLIAFLGCYLFMKLAAPAMARERPRPVWILVLALLALTMPAGLLQTDADRPEPLSFALLLATLVMARSSRPGSRRASWGYFLAGVNFLVSPLGGIVNLLVLLVVHRRLMRGAEKGISLARPALFALPPLAAAGIEIYLDPHSLDRFLAHAWSGRSGAGIFRNAIRSGDVSAYGEALWHSLTSSGAHSLEICLSWAALAGLVVLTTFLRFRRTRNTRTLALGVSSLGLLFMPIVFFPEQNNYLAFVRSTVTALLIYLFISEPSNAPAGRRGILAATLVLLIFQFPLVARETLIRSENGASYRAASALIQTPEITAGAGGGFVAVSPSLYFLFKPRFDVIDVDYLSSGEDLSRVRLLALSYDGSGDPMRFNAPSWLSEGQFHPLFRPVVPQLTRLFGRTISRSSNIWTPAIFENAARQGVPPAAGSD